MAALGSLLSLLSLPLGQQQAALGVSDDLAMWAVVRARGELTNARAVDLFGTGRSIQAHPERKHLDRGEAPRRGGSLSEVLTLTMVPLGSPDDLRFPPRRRRSTIP